jgi:alanyl-tRNA synthetase
VYISGTHITNTRDAKAFALLSEEGIAKGVRRITAVTAGCATQAMELASSIDSDINEASQLEGALLEKVSSFYHFLGILSWSCCVDIA